VAELLEGAPALSVPGIRFDVRFKGPFLGNRLIGKQRLVSTELLRWAEDAFPKLETDKPDYRFEIPIPLDGGRWQGLVR